MRPPEIQVGCAQDLDAGASTIDSARTTKCLGRTGGRSSAREGNCAGLGAIIGAKRQRSVMRVPRECCVPLALRDSLVSRASASAGGRHCIALRRQHESHSRRRLVRSHIRRADGAKRAINHVRQGKGNTEPFLPPQPVDAKMRALPRRVEPCVLSCGLIRKPTEFGMFRR